jgi:hypothetical protein
MVAGEPEYRRVTHIGARMEALEGLPEATSRGMNI